MYCNNAPGPVEDYKVQASDESEMEKGRENGRHRCFFGLELLRNKPFVDDGERKELSPAGLTDNYTEK